MMNGENLSKTQQLRLEQDRMIECIKQGWSKAEIREFWNWTEIKYNSLFRLVYEEVKEYIENTTDDVNLDAEIMKTFNYQTVYKEPKAKKWVDPKTKKEYCDVSEYWGV